MGLPINSWRLALLSNRLWSFHSSQCPCGYSGYDYIEIYDAEFLNFLFIGSSVGIILPSDADKEVFDILENILHGIISQATEEGIEAERRRRAQKAADISSRISNGIVNSTVFF